MDEVLKDVSTLYRMVAELNVVASRLKAANVQVMLCSRADRSDPLNSLAEIRMLLPVDASHERR